MYRSICLAVVGLGLLVSGCDSFRGPALAIPTNKEQTPATSPTSEGSSERATPISRPRFFKGQGIRKTYQGRSLEQWAQTLQASDPYQVAAACQALAVLGHEGRGLLFQGLESSEPETRRMCLERLSICDFKKQGESGRQLLVKMAGDHDDVRIRERATSYLSQWHGTIPAP